MKHIINIDTWERKDNYNFFRGFANSWIAITSEADCTEAFARAKAQGHSFFLYYLYAITRAVNEIKELRYRWDKNGQVVYHDTVDVITSGLSRYGGCDYPYCRTGTYILHRAYSLSFRL